MYENKIQVLNYYDSIEIGDTLEVKGEVENVWITDYGVSVLVDIESDGVSAMCYFNEFDNEIGKHIAITGAKKEFKTSSNPGELDLKKYYNSTEIFLCLEECMVISEDDEYSELLDLFFNIRQGLKSAIIDVCDEEEAGVICAMLFGDKQYLDNEIKELYTMSGIGHILAISGLHISMVGGAVYRFMRKFVRQPVAFMISSGIMLCFCGISGASVSTVRAVIMYMFSIFARVLGRRYDIKNAMAVSMIWLLIDNPLYIDNGGFILSFLSVAGIAFILPNVNVIFKDVLESKSFWSKLFDSFIVSTTLCFVTLMGIASMYYEIPIYSAILNMLLLPLIGFMVVSGFLGGVAYYIAKPLGQCVILLSVIILKFYKLICEIFSALPFNTYVTGAKSYESVVFYYLILIVVISICVYMKRKKISINKILCVMGLGITFLLVLVLSREEYKFTIVVLDIGQGDCIYVESPDKKNYLIDGGSTDEDSIGEYKIEPFLKNRGRDSITAVFITHPDKDHVSGIIELLESESIRIENIIFGQGVDSTNESYIEIYNKAVNLGVKVSYVDEGDVIADEEMEFLVLGPMKNATYVDINAASIVLLGAYGDYEFLMTGDIGSEEEKALLEGRYANLINDVDFLKVAHHGSNNSSCEEFLEWTRPKLAVISCGAGNSYGHPHEDVLERLKNVGSAVRRTDEIGVVIVGE